ncbi:MAG: hypothetical protein ACP5O2_03580 [Bacteroidales bacterium]
MESYNFGPKRMNRIIRSRYLTLVGFITLIISVLFFLMHNELKNAFLQRHILHVAGLTIAIIAIGWMLSIKHNRDGGTIVLFGSLIMLAEAFYSSISLPMLFIVNNLMSAIAGLGLVLWARNKHSD